MKKIVTSLKDDEGFRAIADHIAYFHTIKTCFIDSN